MSIDKGQIKQATDAAIREGFLASVVTQRTQDALDKLLREVATQLGDGWGEGGDDAAYIDALYDVLVDQVDLDGLLDSHDEAGISVVDAFEATVRFADLPEYSDWRAEEDEGLFDAEMDRRYDQLREEGRI